jgi:hypothetical protein
VDVRQFVAARGKDARLVGDTRPFSREQDARLVGERRPFGRKQPNQTIDLSRNVLCEIEEREIEI